MRWRVFCTIWASYLTFSCMYETFSLRSCEGEAMAAEDTRCGVRSSDD